MLVHSFKLKQALFSARALLILSIALLFTACAVVDTVPRNKPAKIESRAGKNKPTYTADTRPATHRVQAGQTLYSLALQYGLDYQDIAAWNQLQNVNIIRVGQQLRLSQPPNFIAQNKDTGTTTIPVNNRIQTMPSAPTIQGIPLTEMNEKISSSPLSTSTPILIQQPLAIKRPYSEAVVGTERSNINTNTPVASTPPIRLTTSSNTQSNIIGDTDSQAKKPRIKKPDNTALEDDNIDLIWPTKGKTIAQFAQVKGLNIAGNMGQSIFAVSDGKIVYSGAGLRGYGKMVIIKHNKKYLTAYAHLSLISVKEGDTVRQGQKIAEMGNTDSEDIKLHFELRRFGTPIDPIPYLN